MKKNNSQVSLLFMLFSMLFTVCLIASNLFETKQIQFFSHSQTGGLIIFPISYIINDVVCEVWGYGKARILIWLGFLMNFFFVAAGALCDWLPGADYWTGDEGFHAIFGLAPRIAAASFAAFICGSFVNAYVMSKMKIWSKGHNFSLRAILSTVFGESVDSLIFFPLALAGVVPAEELPWLMCYQVMLKTGYEIIALPLTIRIVRWVKKYEHEDIYDDNITYNIFKVFEQPSDSRTDSPDDRIYKS
ncbi:MAG: queuosine precursor transporter [Bacteroidales bacterium]|nr:queuosine precursor transporter [Bacteroidales bacterium]MCM1146731.1 queuosine precursor transporter [Bacteroidales bacterium]MCM1205548.1 queuosine precursor transporter [Bacillota bacterium]MCM1509190.1 queuosine precursor transporter [Clostridium sp.]